MQDSQQKINEALFTINDIEQRLQKLKLDYLFAKSRVPTLSFFQELMYGCKAREFLIITFLSDASNTIPVG